MRTTRLAVPIATVVLVLTASTPWAATLNGTVRVGGLIVDEVGDRSTVQETHNLHEGFALSRIQLAGTLDPRNTFTLDLRDLNRDSRAGNFAYRVPGRFRLTAAYDQGRHVFDPGRLVTSERKDWRLGMQFTQSRWLVLSGDVGRVTREGQRLAYPPGTASVLGGRYDAAILNAQLGADVRSGRRGGGVSYRMTDYADALNPGADRRGHVVAARLYAPMPFYDRWTNLVRGSYGVRQLEQGDPEHTLSSFQYTAVVQPEPRYEFRYTFDASRVDDNTTQLETTRFQNDIGATWFHRYGQLSAGYGYEMNDDDRTLTTYHSWRFATTVRPDPRLTARAEYTGRVKRDQEELTLLKDMEASRVRVRVEARPVERLTIGADFTRRERDLPDIGVSVDGQVAGAVVRYELPGWGALAADYSHATDRYVDLLAPFDTRSDIVTARLELARIKPLRVAGGVTYLDIGRDLDIEKSTVFVETDLKVWQRYHLEVKYHCYNYDDYILIDRYYTANVVRIDLGYDLGP
jgi:hypothetical protein